MAFPLYRKGYAIKRSLWTSQFIDDGALKASQICYRGVANLIHFTGGGLVVLPQARLA
jgi:hypothetical protein